MDITFTDALLKSVSSMIIVFIILAVIMLVIILFRYLPKDEIEQVKEKTIPFEEMDEDMKVAVLIATIECQKEYGANVKLKSVKRI